MDPINHELLASNLESECDI